MGRTNWYSRHPPYCTCARCDLARRSRLGQKQDRPSIPRQRRKSRKWLVLLPILVGIGTWAHLTDNLPATLQQQTDRMETAVEPWVSSTFEWLDPWVSRLLDWLDPGEELPLQVESPNEPSGVPPLPPLPPRSQPPATPIPVPTQPPDDHVPVVPIPSATPTPKPSNDSDSRRYALAEQLLAERINQFRISRGLTPLTPNDALGEVARANSQDMHTRVFFRHENPDGRGPQGRVDQAGLAVFSCGENIMQSLNETSNNPKNIANEAFSGWLNSLGHYENMIRGKYDTGGIGIFVKRKFILDAIPVRYDIYVTHLLCRDMTEYRLLKAQYDELNSQYQAAQTHYENVAATVDRLKSEYQHVENGFIQNAVTYDEVQNAYQSVETAIADLNVRVNVTNRLVARLNELAARLNEAA